MAGLGKRGTSGSLCQLSVCIRAGIDAGAQQQKGINNHSVKRGNNVVKKRQVRGPEKGTGPVPG